MRPGRPDILDPDTSAACEGIGLLPKKQHSSENALQHTSQPLPTHFREHDAGPRQMTRGGGTPLPPHRADLLEEYRAQLVRAPLSPESRRTYLSKVCLRE